MNLISPVMRLCNLNKNPKGVSLWDFSFKLSKRFNLDNFLQN
ncbi:hypothetical protein F542_3140 [Bibersteinia trehalosi USDA-ARS-USMARC-188]|uniref:Uncharacterized protein n=3 Tax=Bibersteinia trehalosi TaxID=47735 RepID=W0R7Q2_BIBTR|nr:hypothetical protein WQG_19440 [Bibersteinia trehalosi USDA-ARS-USMARC-192]AHG81032.1 hypothetical protein F542_3140 [Bibersteinia trehalosi USDA-ARS-USMARC-188]AHG83243.1 hypothetical protein F543_3790 [Bibersteinia trehalosi USDA-ARS-USMARC-189]AHG87154.1 hypothetical protein F544_19260 [Bibersteinia trehalosi USDA-ARS-USMARC-190]